MCLGYIVSGAYYGIGKKWNACFAGYTLCQQFALVISSAAESATMQWNWDDLVYAIEKMMRNEFFRHLSTHLYA